VELLYVIAKYSTHIGLIHLLHTILLAYTQRELDGVLVEGFVSQHDMRHVLAGLFKVPVLMIERNPDTLEMIIHGYHKSPIYCSKQALEDMGKMLLDTMLSHHTMIAGILDEVLLVGLLGYSPNESFDPVSKILATNSIEWSIDILEEQNIGDINTPVVWLELIAEVISADSLRHHHLHAFQREYIDIDAILDCFDELIGHHDIAIIWKMVARKQILTYLLNAPNNANLSLLPLVNMLVRVCSLQPNSANLFNTDEIENILQYLPRICSVSRYLADVSLFPIFGIVTIPRLVNHFTVQLMPGLLLGGLQHATSLLTLWKMLFTMSNDTGYEEAVVVNILHSLLYLSQLIVSYSHLNNLSHYLKTILITS
jgi:hypothetical protein